MLIQPEPDYVCAPHRGVQARTVCRPREPAVAPAFRIVDLDLRRRQRVSPLIVAGSLRLLTESRSGSSRASAVSRKDLVVVSRRTRQRSNRNAGLSRSAAISSSTCPSSQRDRRPPTAGGNRRSPGRTTSTSSVRAAMTRRNERRMQQRNIGRGHIRDDGSVVDRRQTGGQALEWPSALSRISRQTRSRRQAQAALGLVRARRPPVRRPRGRPTRSLDAAAWSRATPVRPLVSPSETTARQPRRSLPLRHQPMLDTTR